MEELNRLVREEWGRLTALLLARFRRLDLVEDALGDAVEAAARRWPSNGAPENPSAWVLTAARRRIIDRLRAEAMHRRRMPLLAVDARRAQEGPVMADPGGLVEDELLRLVLMCAHPALAPEAASALSLRLVLGVSTHDIARLFLVSEPTMAARLTRAKRKIVGAAIPFAVPSAEDLPSRLETVARTAYLAFTAGYAPGSGADPLRVEVAGEAIRLVRVVRELVDTPVLDALLALMLLQHSRRDARADSHGRIVLLPDQDRSRWHHHEIREAVTLLDSPSLTGPLSRLAATYTLQARIAAEHATAPTSASTRWHRIVEGYDMLLTIDPSPAARLARAVAVAEAEGPESGLAALDAVDLQSHRLPAVRADLLARLGRSEEAHEEYSHAISLCRNDAELAHLREQRDRLA
ncbi:MAG: sigma factor-like helix-turn-helix DNA-binding protein [bacterium]|nr:sigma factor-like helix-turn-helix DNA-binding protein [bacterium]